MFLISLKFMKSIGSLIASEQRLTLRRRCKLWIGSDYH